MERSDFISGIFVNNRNSQLLKFIFCSIFCDYNNGVHKTPARSQDLLAQVHNQTKYFLDGALVFLNDTTPLGGRCLQVQHF